jgi:hypothetical protein
LGSAVRKCFGPSPSPPEDTGKRETKLTGTPSQIEWAELIRPRVSAEFDRVAKALTEAAAGNREVQVRMDAEAVIAILEEKRAEVMSKEHAGYFIRDWQELTDQVRQMISQDSRYQAIKARKAARSESPART